MAVSATSALLAAVTGAAASLGAAIAFGGPTKPQPLASINEAFKDVDLSDLPAPLHFTARDGQSLTYRRYLPTERADKSASVTLVHGSSASSQSMHPLATRLASAGFEVYALDVRGHGESGEKGHIAYVGQLEDDLADFVAAVQPASPSTLAGFSSGGGFALRVAAGVRAELFDSYLLLSPFLGQDAPNYRPASGGWVSVGVPRIIALSALNAVGFSALNHLPVTSFALNERGSALLTPLYDFNLATNFRPERDYISTMGRVAKPCSIVAGANDEAFHTDRLEATVRASGKDWRVRLLPKLGHIALTLDAVAADAIAQEVEVLQRISQSARATN